MSDDFPKAVCASLPAHLPKIKRGVQPRVRRGRGTEEIEFSA
jgi:hypothetical protein